MRILFAILMTLAMVASCCGDDHPFYVSDDAPFALTVGDDFPFDAPQAPDKQILLFLSESCPPCVTIREEVIPAMEETGWTFGEYGHVKVVEGTSGVFSRYDHGNGYPLAVCIEGGEEVRRIEPGCTLSVDSWSLYWLYTGRHHEKAPAKQPLPATVERTGLYPLRGGWWTVDGMTRPTREYLIDHLDRASAHDDKFKRWWLESLSYAELHSLHSDDHEGRLQTRYVNRTPQKRASLTRRSTPHGRGLLRSIFTRRAYCPTCPN